MTGRKTNEARLRTNSCWTCPMTFPFVPVITYRNHVTLKYHLKFVPFHRDALVYTGSFRRIYMFGCERTKGPVSPKRSQSDRYVFRERTLLLVSRSFELSTMFLRLLLLSQHSSALSKEDQHNLFLIHSTRHNSCKIPISTRY